MSCALWAQSTSLSFALAFAAPASDPAEVMRRAHAAEERAFVAVDQQQWCMALLAFLEADALAPDPDLLYNAARAADLAGDRTQALTLYSRVLEGATKARKAEVKKRLPQLVLEVERHGTGSACRGPGAPSPVLGADDPAPPTAAAKGAAGAPAPSVGAAAATLPTTALPGPGVHGAPAGAAVARAEATPSPTWPWLAVVGGGGVAVVGAVLAAVGAGPWFSYLDAQEGLRDAEQQGRLDVDALVAAQASAGRAWEAWGKPSLVAGLTAGAAGLLVSGIGAVAFVTTPHEDTP